MRRSSLPTSVSPGSKVSSTVWPRATSQSRRSRDWVDLPAPSPPSKQTKRPCSEKTPALTSHTLRAGWDRSGVPPDEGAADGLGSDQAEGGDVTTEVAERTGKPTPPVGRWDRYAAWSLLLVTALMYVGALVVGERETDVSALREAIGSGDV